MKKFTFLLIVAFVTALILSSCSKKDCPAYSKVDKEQTGHNV